MTWADQLIRLSRFEVEVLQKRLAEIVERRTVGEIRLALLVAEGEAERRRSAPVGWRGRAKGGRCPARWGRSRRRVRGRPATAGQGRRRSAGPPPGNRRPAGSPPSCLRAAPRRWRRRQPRRRG